MAECAEKIINSTLTSCCGNNSVSTLFSSLPLVFLLFILLFSLLLTRALNSDRRTRLDSGYGDRSPAYNPQYQPDTEMSTFPDPPPSYDEVISSRDSFIYYDNI